MFSFLHQGLNSGHHAYKISALVTEPSQHRSALSLLLTYPLTWTVVSIRLFSISMATIFFSIQWAFFFVRRHEALCNFCSKYDEGDDKEWESKPGAGGIEYGFSFLCCSLWQRLYRRRNNLVNFRPCFPFTRLNCQFSVHPSLTMLCESILTLRKNSFHNIFAWHNSVIRAVCKA